MPPRKTFCDWLQDRKEINNIILKANMTNEDC